jgi:hypothetical protein
LAIHNLRGDSNCTSEQDAPEGKVQPKAFGGVQTIEDALKLTEEMAAADFTARLELVVRHLVERISESKLDGEALRGKITNFIFTGDLKNVRQLANRFCADFAKVVLLFDNLDKGWPAAKIEPTDIRIVRLLLEALQRMQRELEKERVDFQHLIFLRDDVYELLVQETPDRGKYNIVRVDWSDPDQLKQLMVRRVDLNARLLDVKTQQLWDVLIPARANGTSAFATMVQYSLMRPRFLIELTERALAYAVNRGHAEVSVADLEDAIRQHSLYLVSDFGYEIRDVSGLTEDIFYSFIGMADKLDGERLTEIVRRADPRLPSDTVIRLLLWYGFLGFQRNGGAIFIFDTNYDMRRLKAEIHRFGPNPTYAINPAFLKGLS